MTGKKTWSSQENKTDSCDSKNESKLFMKQGNCVHTTK